MKTPPLNSHPVVSGSLLKGGRAGRPEDSAPMSGPSELLRTTTVPVMP